jgi:hypothetical protein
VNEITSQEKSQRRNSKIVSICGQVAPILPLSAPVQRCDSIRSKGIFKTTGYQLRCGTNVRGNGKRRQEVPDRGLKEAKDLEVCPEDDGRP